VKRMAVDVFVSRQWQQREEKKIWRTGQARQLDQEHQLGEFSEEENGFVLKSKQTESWVERVR
jgi:hypothetical protein